MFQLAIYYRLPCIYDIALSMYENLQHNLSILWKLFYDEEAGLILMLVLQQVKDQQSCIFVFVACLTIPSSTYRYQPRLDNSIPSMGIRYIYRDTEQPKEKETSLNKLRLQFSRRTFDQ